MIITQTPLRISFLGGNTDYPSYYTKHGGVVLATAINKYVYCIVKERLDNLIIINYSQRETCERVRDVRHDFVREAMILLNIRPGIEIAFMADIPSEGSGLGSSSSTLVGLLLALHGYRGESVSTSQLIEEACFIEINVLNNPIGVQDQNIVALGGIREMRWGTDSMAVARNSEIQLIQATRNRLDNSLMLFSTGIARRSSEILSSISLDPESMRQNKALAERGIEAMRYGDIPQLGRLLAEYWEIKKSLGSKISNPTIDSMYSEAMKAGAYGGKIAGAGGGGYLALIVPSEKRNDIRHVLAGYNELPVRVERDGAKTIFNIRRYE